MKVKTKNSKGTSDALSVSIDMLSNRLPKMEINVETLKGLEKALLYTARYGELSFKDLKKVKRIDGYKIIDYDTSSDGYSCFGYSYWVELKNRKKRIVRIDFKHNTAHGSYKDIRYVLENLPITDWDINDL